MSKLQRHISTLFITWVCVHKLAAQPFLVEIDSLNKVLHRSLTDSVRMNLYNALSAYRHPNNYSLALSYASQALELSEKLQSPHGKAKAYQNIALAHWANGRYSEALHFHGLALDLFLRYDMREQFAEAYNKIGLVYFYIADYPNAIEFLNRSETEYRKAGDTVNLSRVINNLGLIYDSRGEYGKSTMYFTEALKLDLNFRNLHEQSWKTFSNDADTQDFTKRKLLQEKLQKLAARKQLRPSLSLAATFFEIAILYGLLEQHTEAVNYFEKANACYDALGEKRLVANANYEMARILIKLDRHEDARILLRQANQLNLNHEALSALDNSITLLARVERKLGNPRQAIKHYKEVLQLNDTLRQRIAAIRVRTELAEVCLAENLLAESEKHATEAFRQADELGIQQRKAEAAYLLYRILRSEKDYAQAIYYLEQNREIAESINNAELNREIAAMQIRFETAEKQNEIDRLHELAVLQKTMVFVQRQMIGLLSLSIVAILLLLLFVNNRLKVIRKLNADVYARNEQIAEQNLMLEKRRREKETLIGEIHHRVKNNLQVIGSLLRLQLRDVKDQAAMDAIREGQNRVRSMSLLHQRLYQQGAYEKIEAGGYIRDIYNDLLVVFDVKKMLKNPRFKMDQIWLEVETAVALGLIVNEVYANIFKHACNGPGQVLVKTELTGNREATQLIISDNGPGLPPHFDKKQETFGIKLIKMLAVELDGEVWFTGGSENGLTVRLMVRHRIIHNPQPLTEA